MTQKKEVCENCFMAISHPICSECQIKHINYWLKDAKVNSLNKREIIKSIKKLLLIETLNNDKCVICRKNALAICSYCSFLKISRILTLHNSSLNKDNFSQMFNYSFEEENSQKFQNEKSKR